MRCGGDPVTFLILSGVGAALTLGSGINEAVGGPKLLSQVMGGAGAGAGLAGGIGGISGAMGAAEGATQAGLSAAEAGTSMASEAAPAIAGAFEPSMVPTTEELSAGLLADSGGSGITGPVGNPNLEALTKGMPNDAQKMLPPSPISSPMATDPYNTDFPVTYQSDARGPVPWMQPPQLDGGDLRLPTVSSPQIMLPPSPPAATSGQRMSVELPSMPGAAPMNQSTNPTADTSLPSWMGMQPQDTPPAPPMPAMGGGPLQMPPSPQPSLVDSLSQMPSSPAPAPAPMAPKPPDTMTSLIQMWMEERKRQMAMQMAGGAMNAGLQAMRPRPAKANPWAGVKLS